ncbi:MAG: prepilin-type N-terminal cleavage/methylation domain-containing protein [Candidatus Zixiibacteriota bacterium]|nr:MAG: prepilin-type N-terminal cleavage/methylation domain-containing protein [candidate division Zixibacteria bacterium]
MSNSRGVSLLEVMISMIILAFGILGLAPMVVLSIEGNVISRDHTVAANLLKQKVEYYEGLDSILTVPYREYEQGLSNIYSRTTYIKDNSVDTLLPSGVYQIDVVVSWLDNENVKRSTSYSTYILKS